MPSKRKKKSSSLFDDPFGLGQTADKATTVDPNLFRVLDWLREGPKHRDWLRVRVENPKALVDDLRQRGHVIKSVKFYARPDWVYCLSEGGRLCGVSGEVGVDDDTSLAAGNQ